MANHLGTYLDNFSRRESPALWIGSSAIICVSLLVLFVLSATAGNWLQTGLIGIAFAAAAAFCTQNWLLFRRKAADSDRKLIDWQTAGSDVQRQTLHLEVRELSKILEVGSEQIAELQSVYIVAEDLALRQIQQEENVPLMRHVTIGKAPFEAVMVKDDVISCIDVSFLVVPDLRQEKITSMLKKIGRVKATFAEAGIRMKVRLMMVLVTQLTPEDDERLRGVLYKQRFEETPVDVDIRLLDFESLQKLYVTAE